MFQEKTILVLVNEVLIFNFAVSILQIGLFEYIVAAILAKSLFFISKSKKITCFCSDICNNVDFTHMINTELIFQVFKLLALNVMNMNKR